MPCHPRSGGDSIVVPVCDEISVALEDDSDTVRKREGLAVGGGDVEVREFEDVLGYTDRRSDQRDEQLKNDSVK